MSASSVSASSVSASSEAKPRGRQRSVEAESAILTATVELLRKKCLRDVTADAIAERAGVSKATLYKWWPNKNLIALDAFLARMKTTVPVPDTGSALKDFTEHLKAIIHFYTSPGGGAIRHFIAEGQSDPAFLAIFRDRFLKNRRAEAHGIWQHGVKRGEIREELDEDLVMDLIYGPMIFRLLAGHAPLDDEHAEAIVAAAFRGVQKKKS